jgi:hypothetical protein
MRDDWMGGGDDLVSVPVPKRFLPAVYRALAEAMAAEAAGGTPLEPRAGKRNLIDLIVTVAYGIGADRHPVALGELHAAYLRAYPGVGKGASRASFDATVNYHCINMRSRFPDAHNPRKPAYWLARPIFKRVARARYMLLSEEEIALFRRCVEEGNPLVYAEEYDVADLARVRA